MTYHNYKAFLTDFDQTERIYFEKGIKDAIFYDHISVRLSIKLFLRQHEKDCLSNFDVMLTSSITGKIHTFFYNSVIFLCLPPDQTRPDLTQGPDKRLFDNRGLWTGSMFTSRGLSSAGLLLVFGSLSAMWTRWDGWTWTHTSPTCVPFHSLN